MDAAGVEKQVSRDHAVRVMAWGFGFLAFAMVAGAPELALVVGTTTALVTWHQELLRFPVLIASILAITLFVPFGRYELPVEFPFGVDLYRIAVFVVMLLWLGMLLADEDARVRRSPFDVPLAIIVGATLASVVVNMRNVEVPEAVVLKAVVLFLSFILVYYFIVSVVTRRSTIEHLTMALVASVSVVAVFAVIEQRSGFNVFDHLEQVLPLHFDGPVDVERDGVIRAIASAEHPIALGVLFAMTAPIGVALAFGSSRRWWIPTTLITLGIVSTVSRTPLLVAIGGGAVLVWLRPREVKALLPLAIPLVLVLKLAMPGSLATLKNSFFPEQGLVEQQTVLTAESDPLLAGGRVRQIGPSLREAARTPLLGQGLGSRQTGFDNPLRNAPILDNQWLSHLLTVGIIGTAGWVALILGAVKGLGRASRVRAGPEGWLAVGYAASMAGFAVGMFTYDSLSFGQVTFVFWFVLALSASLLQIERRA